MKIHVLPVSPASRTAVAAVIAGVGGDAGGIRATQANMEHGWHMITSGFLVACRLVAAGAEVRLSPGD